MDSPPAKMVTGSDCTAGPWPPPRWEAGSACRAPARDRERSSRLNCRSLKRFEMHTPIPHPNRRILIVDDNPSIHEAFRKILTLQTEGSELEQDEAALFDRAVEKSPAHDF